MKINKTFIEDLLIIEPQLFKDERGFFYESYNKNNLDKNYAIAKAAYDSGENIFKGITVALQSFNKNTLDIVERFNLDFDTLKTYFDKYKADNIPTYSELIWPLPGETFESLKSGVQQLIDAGQENYLMIHPLVITDNSPMGNKAYQKKHGLDVRKIALDTVYLGADEKYITEYTDVVYATATADHETVIEGHMYAWLTILMYYYGWGHYIAKYMRKQGVLETELFEDLLQWIKENIEVENIAKVETIIFDKTGTITTSNKTELLYKGSELSIDEFRMIKSVLRASNHPLSRTLYNFIDEKPLSESLTEFEEVIGKGIIATINKVTIQLGSASFLGVSLNSTNETAIYVKINDDGLALLNKINMNEFDSCLNKISEKEAKHLNDILDKLR